MNCAQRSSANRLGSWPHSDVALVPEPTQGCTTTTASLSARMGRCAVVDTRVQWKTGPSVQLCALDYCLGKKLWGCVGPLGEPALKQKNRLAIAPHVEKMGVLGLDSLGRRAAGGATPESGVPERFIAERASSGPNWSQERHFL